jgi:hypothetical protein
MIASELIIAEVSELPLDVAAHERAVVRASAGAHVVFCGVVRDVDRGRRVVELTGSGACWSATSRSWPPSARCTGTRRSKCARDWSMR